MLYESGVALSGENPWTIGPRVAHLLAHPEQLRAMRQAALALGRPRAAYDVAAELWRIAR
jgi:processive 1,2-diacylglycerol beta-glucosyltransferase